MKALGRPLESFKAGVFDLDGVVTRTAGMHCAAWQQLFDAYLRARQARTGEAFDPFDPQVDYLRHVDGKPRYDGVQSFLASRAVTLPYGDPDDPPDRETICGLGNRKNQLFNDLLAQGRVEVFDASVTFIERLRAAGLKTALVSSSENAAAVLESAGLSQLFDARIDGVVAAQLQLKGKPEPDIFRHAAGALGVSPQEALAVEDALSGVASAKAAGYGLVIAIDRAAQREALLAQGADIVVNELDELLGDCPEQHAPLPDALTQFAELADRLTQQRPAVFLDYDGTLTPIVERPELAVLDAAMRATLRTLAARCPVAIVSGRDRANVTQLVALDSLVYAGSHGFDIAGPGGLRMQHERAAEFLPALDAAEDRLRERLATLDGVLIERKRFAIATHFRRVADAEVDAVNDAVEAVAVANPQLRRTGGKKVFELRPQLPWDKGKAVMWLLEALDLQHDAVVPIYIGDDETDEDAFAALREHGGIALYVGEAAQTTAAHYRLDDTHAVGRFLDKLAATLDT